MSAETTGLEHLVCFQLHAASRAMTSLYRRTLETHGLTYTQYIALRVIWHHDAITVRDLGKALDLDSGTLSPLLKRLETQGHVTRERGTHDERTVTIRPTPHSHDLRRQLTGLPEQLACTTNLSTDELTQLHHLLGRIRTAANPTP